MSSLVDVRGNLFQLRLGDLRALHSGVFKGATHLVVLAGHLDEPGQERIVYFLVDVNPRSRSAYLQPIMSVL